MNKIRIKKLLFIFCLLFAVFAAADLALAATAGPDVGLETAAGTGLGASDPRIIAANIIRIILGFLGIIAVGLIIFAGWLWMTANGEEEKVAKAKKILIGAVVGLVICLASFAIASFILSRLLGATGVGSDGSICQPACSSGQYCCNSSCSNAPCGNIGGGGGGLETSCDANTLQPGCQIDFSKCGPGRYCNTTSCTCKTTNLPGEGQSCLKDALDTQCAAGQCAAGLSCSSTDCLCKKTNQPTEGQSCDGDTNLAGCQAVDCADSLVCSSGDNCTCIKTPLIAWVSPLDAADTPNGAIGNFITIGGRYFGTTVGQVIFMGDPNNASDDKVATFPNQVNPLCTSFWQDDQIIAVVPSGAVSGPIKVVDSKNYYDTTDNNRGARIKDFLINNIKRPGLCDVNPNSGGLADRFNLQGAAFNLSPHAVFFGNSANPIAANDISGWTNTAVDAAVPNIKDGRSSVFVQTNNINSNNLGFTIRNNADTNPAIEYIEPDKGPAGQYITIYGRNFKTYNAQKSLIKFYLPADPNAKINADIDFPEACRDNWWHNTYIIVKVPKVNSLGTYKVEVTNTDNKVSLPADFTINNETPSPGLCLLNPNNGPVGWPVAANGERFGNAQGTGRVQYFNNKDGAVRGWADKKIDTNVPLDSASGPFKIIDGQGYFSNPLPFRVGKCATSAECDASQNEECCGGGTYWSGICRTAGTCLQGSPTACGFGWTFKTGQKQVGDFCYDGAIAGTCDITKSRCGTNLVCDTSSCVCKKPCNSDLNNDKSKCVPDNGKCSGTNTPVCSLTKCVCECTKDTDCINGESCNPATNTCDPGPKIESCSGYDLAQCNNSYFCPNSPGKCSSYGGGAADTEVKCGDDACKELAICKGAENSNLCSYIKDDTNKNIDNKCKKNSSFCLKPQTLKDPDGNDVTAECSLLSGYGNPVWNYNSSGDCLTDWAKDQTRNKCVTPAYNNVECKPCTAGAACGLPQTFADAAVKEIEGNAVMVQCSKVDNKAVWYYASSKTCVTGWVKNINRDKCVKQTYDGKSCELCDAGFSCQQDGVNEINNGICVTDKICPAGSSCSADNKCLRTIQPSCECCCDISQNNTTTGNNPGCCAPLTCAGRCGSDIGKATPATLGQCTGCGGVGTTQTEHNAACNCTGTSGKFCKIDSANPAGVCQDCAQISDAAICSGQGIGTCCVDAMNKNACAGNTLYDSSNNPIYGSGSPVNHYCAYFQCQKTAASATCSGPVASSTLPIYKTSNCDDKCTVSPDFGQPCAKKVAKVDQCAADVCANFSCLNADSYGIGSPYNPVGYLPSAKNNTCGTCCCDPNLKDSNGDKIDQCQRFINPKLSCLADKGNCSGSSRGLCCGCSKDSECGNSPDTVGCGSDTCCQARPKVIDGTVSPRPDNYPKPFGSNICRNSQIQATFNKAMRIDTFKGNVIVAGYYETSQCPAGTQYLTAAYKPTILARIKFWLAKIPLVNKLFASEALALTGNFCTITGTVSGSVNGDETKLIFKPQQLLEANRTYYVIIKGETDISDAVHNGVLSQDGIGIKGDGYFNSLSNTYENPAMFNGLSFSNAKIWYFKTMASQAANNGACEIDHAEITPVSKLFQTNINEVKDDDASKDTFDKIEDSDKLYTAEALATDGTVLNSLAGIYSWNWVLTSGSTNIFEFITPAGDSLSNNEGLLRAKANVKEGESVIKAVATASNNKVYPAETKANLMVCANPWPPVKPDGTWEAWGDNLKCNDGNGSCEGLQENQTCKDNTGKCIKNCTVQTASCDNTNFELSYCRDAGGPGTADDLPAILSDTAVIRGKDLKCIGGSNNNAACSNDAGCPAGRCGGLLKEFYFFREESQLPAGGFTVSALEQGGGVKVTWNKVAGAAGYKIYYSTTSSDYAESIDVAAQNGPEATQTKEIVGLTNGLPYYFALTSYNAKKVESEYNKLSESVIPNDTEIPVAPEITSVVAKGNKVEVAWQDQSLGDAKRFKLFYGVTDKDFGASVNISYNTHGTTTVSNLANGVTYYFGLVGYDFDNNPSATSTVKSIVAGINLTAIANNITKQGKTVALYWNNFAPVAGKTFEKYLVYYGTAPDSYGTPIATTTLPTAANPQIISNLVNGTKYYFAIKAKYTSGDESEYSNIISVTPADTWSPWTPQNLTGATTTTGVILSWQANNDDTAFYKIYYGGISGNLRATADLNKNQCSTSTGKCTINIDNLNIGAKYYFSITALDVYDNESNKSAEINLKIE